MPSPSAYASIKSAHKCWHMLISMPAPAPFWDHADNVILGVTGASVHAPIQRNSPYGHTVILYIYDTRLPRQPHPPIRWYEQRSQEPALRTHYIESFPDIRNTYIYVYGPVISANIVITTSTLLLLQYSAYWYISYQTLSLSLELEVPSWHYYILNSNRLAISDLIWLTVSELILLTVFYLIWLSF